MRLSSSSWAYGAGLVVSKRWLAQDSISIRDDQLLLCKLEGVEEGARQETEQLHLVVVDSEEAVHHSFSNSFPSLGPCRALEGVWQVAVPH